LTKYRENSTTKFIRACIIVKSRPHLGLLFSIFTICEQKNHN
jgi:hypothetical protein